MATQAAPRTVLLADDEPSIRALLRRHLLNLAFQVLEAPNGSKALEVAKQRQAPIDVLVTDVVMPQINGCALAARVTSIHPETRVLFITGQAGDHSEIKDTLRWTPHAFLLKPFTSTALSQKVELLLLTRGGVQAWQPPTSDIAAITFSGARWRVSFTRVQARFSAAGPRYSGNRATTSQAA